jgi:hypothetical protein
MTSKPLLDPADMTQWDKAYLRVHKAGEALRLLPDSIECEDEFDAAIGALEALQKARAKVIRDKSRENRAEMDKLRAELAKLT